jgi:nitronate monooxygenase
MTVSSTTQALLDLLKIDHPVIQAPMAGTSNPVMAAAVANAGGLGSIGVGAMTASAADEAIRAFKDRSNRSLNVNVFCHQPAKPDAAVEHAWLSTLAAEFRKFGAKPPTQLTEIYKSYLEDDDMHRVLLAAKPRVVSFHFGTPAASQVRELREAGITLIASATNLVEGQALVEAGMHAVIAQGYEAGGHRGTFDADGHDDKLGTFTLTRMLARDLSVPVIAAGGIMDGYGVAAALKLGAAAAQLGTAFVAASESSADEAYRHALASSAAHHTTMTRGISGRPARCLANSFTALSERLGGEMAAPAYPIAYDAGKALNAAARKAGDGTYGAQWAGQGAPMARAMPAGDLVRTIVDEALR